MEQPPFIDDIVREIDAPPDRVWPALLATVNRSIRSVPAWLTAAWGLEHSSRSGAPDGSVAVGDTIPGFAVVAVHPGRALVLQGSHRFSRYELRFELEPMTGNATRLHAQTFAAFPGVKGWVYRTLVIGTGGHRIAVRRMLTGVAQRSRSA
jgi:hypothetical protein